MSAAPKSSPAPPLFERIRTLVGQGATGPLRHLLADADPLEVADAFYNFNLLEQMTLLGLLPEQNSAQVLPELNESALVALLGAFDDAWLVRRIGLMEPDDGVSLLRLLDGARQEALLQRLDPERRVALRQLLTYAADTAGGIMDPDVVRVRADETVAQAIEHIRQYVHQVQLDDFFSIFVVSPDDVLVGAVPNWKMLLARPEQRIAEIMIPEVIAVEAHEDQEEVGRVVRHHDLVTVPVVDYHRRLIGRITVDDIVDVLAQEFQEDLGRMSGTGSEDVREFSFMHTLRVRAPWLLVALVGEFLLAVIMRNRQGFLVAVPQLAFFIPLIMAMGGNAGVQSSSLVIRGLATGEVRLSHFRRRLLREVLVALCVGAIFAIILLAGGAALTGNLRLGATVGAATLTVVLLAAAFGTAMPMLLQRLGQDPARWPQARS